MVSRKTARVLGELFEAKFTHSSRDDFGDRSTKVFGDSLYDFLFEHDFPAWLCNMAKRLYQLRREVQELVMQLHTGETVAKETPNWSWKQRGRLGQEFLEGLAEKIVGSLDRSEPFVESMYGDKIDRLLGSLEIDGYSWDGTSLLRPEADAVDAVESRGVIEGLYSSLGLPKSEVALHHLSLSEEHYLAKRWDDSISNSRKFLECTLEAVACKHSEAVRSEELSSAIVERPVEVRSYLEEHNLLEAREAEALAKVYGLLSNTGGHPYMAQNDQARLLRHLALTFCQFVLLRLQGSLTSSKTSARPTTPD